MGIGRNLTSAAPATATRSTIGRSPSVLERHLPTFQVPVWIRSLGALALGLLVLADASEGREISGLDLGAPELGDCGGLERATSTDEWALLEYQVGPAGIDLDAMELGYSSSWTYGAGLRECAVAGHAGLPRRGEGLHTLFRYRPARSLEESRDGRRFEFRPSSDFRGSVRGLDGNLAVRIETDASGRTLTSELLFASNLDLGALVLDHFHDNVSVVAEGAPGSKVDVVYFRFENGQVVTFSQLHYSPRN